MNRGMTQTQNADGELTTRGAAGTAGARPDLQKAPKLPRRFLVFTSAGDRNAVARWLGPGRDFNLWVAYYDGTRPTPLEHAADYFLRRAGSKFQNLHYCFQRWPDLLERYEAIMVMDDDIRISPEKLDRLFALREQHDLWALQPAFSPWGKVSHRVTRVRRDCELRFVSFIELACPLFRTDKLLDFLRVYDPILVGWGCDWWFMHTLGPDLRDRVAVIDNVACINPWDWWKRGGYREIDRLESRQQRQECWERIRVSRGIVSAGNARRALRCVRHRGWARWARFAWGVLERLPVRIAAWSWRTGRQLVHRQSALPGHSSPRALNSSSSRPR